MVTAECALLLPQHLAGVDRRTGRDHICLGPLPTHLLEHAYGELPPPAPLTAPVGPLFVPKLLAEPDAAVSPGGGASESELAVASHTAREQSLAVHASCEPSRE